MQMKYRFAGVARIHPAPMAQRAWGAERSAGECLWRGQRGQVAFPKGRLGFVEKVAWNKLHVDL